MLIKMDQNEYDSFRNPTSRFLFHLTKSPFSSSSASLYRFSTYPLFCQYDYVERSTHSMLVKAEELPKISFHAIAVGRWSNLLFHYHTQSMEPQFIILDEEDETLRLDPLP